MKLITKQARGEVDVRYVGRVSKRPAPWYQQRQSPLLIVGRDKRGVALLFAGGDQGGANGQGLTYANPLRTVLDALKVDLAL